MKLIFLALVVVVLIEQSIGYVPLRNSSAHNATTGLSWVKDNRTMDPSIGYVPFGNSSAQNATTGLGRGKDNSTMDPMDGMQVQPRKFNAKSFAKKLLPAVVDGVKEAYNVFTEHKKEDNKNMDKLPIDNDKLNTDQN